MIFLAYWQFKIASENKRLTILSKQERHKKLLKFKVKNTKKKIHKNGIKNQRLFQCSIIISIIALLHQMVKLK